jgi:hypothetical protein
MTTLLPRGPDMVDRVDLYEIAEVLKRYTSTKGGSACSTSSDGRVMDPSIIPGNHWSIWGTLLNVLKTSTRNTWWL